MSRDDTGTGVLEENAINVDQGGPCRTTGDESFTPGGRGTVGTSVRGDREKGDGYCSTFSSRPSNSDLNLYRNPKGRGEDTGKSWGSWSFVQRVGDSRGNDGQGGSFSSNSEAPDTDTRVGGRR